MRRIRALVIGRDEREVLNGVGRLGSMQLIRTRSEPDAAPLSARDCGKELARCERLLARAQELRQSLNLPPSAGILETPDMTLPQAEAALRAMEERCDGLLKRRQLLGQRWSETNAISERVSSYRGWEVPLDSIDTHSFLHFVTGSLPSAKLKKLQQEIGDNMVLLPLLAQKNRQSLVAMTTNRGWLALGRVLQEADFQTETLPIVKGATVDTLSEDNQREQEMVATALEELEVDVQALAAGFARPLAELESLAKRERCLLDAEQHALRTETTVLLSGWVPEDDAMTLERRIVQITGGRCVVEIVAPGHGIKEQIPVLLRHPRLLRPFEMLVSAFGLPKYQELEPTLFVAISYVLMFGMMFGDVGHGALLAGGGVFALLAGRNEKVRDAGVLVLFAALSSILFGFVYGSCFGLESFKEYALWHDPLEGDPMALMYGAIGIGIAVISLGLLLNIINRFRRGDVVGGFLDKFGVIGLVFYWGVLALITKYDAFESRGLVNLAMVLFLGLPVVGWAIKEPLESLRHRHVSDSAEHGDGLFAAITESLVGAFEAVLSYLANTISFVRLAAYAMSHAALLVAAFMMAEEARNFSVGGGVLSVFIVILGNLVAIVLEGIIASVQALRLEYYEFFGKFFSGGGQPFKPFRLIPSELAWKGAQS